MILGPGDRVGVYELAELLGVGGMGEVYRARDTRLNREVAIKLLHAALASDSERLQRFDQEARATAALSDPNIVAIYDVGIHGGRPFVVSELLEGETLRQALGTGPLPMRKAIGYGQQIARGMAAAHRRGIAHRDLKPENLFITRDGLVKILDFGLAKLARETFATTIAAEATAPGIVMGTIGYMSPEQARGEPSDSRADIFSFGAILYEMLSGQRAFQRASAAETLSAILKEHPPDLTQLVTGLSPELTRIVDRCLEKNREDRFQSATDLSFALEGILGTSTRSAASTHRRPVRWRTAAGVLVAIAATGAAFMMGERLTHGEPPRFQQLTFRRGTVQNARFAADGQTIVYAAAWEGRPTELFSTRPEAAEARPFDMTATGLFALSSKAEMALALKPQGFGRVEGTLARAPLAGGVPRQLADSVLAADWTPDGSGLAVVQSRGGNDSLEYPEGQTLYEPAPGHITHIRFSPSGDAIAVISHPVMGDTAGSVVLVDLAGKARTLSSGWNSVLGLAWSPNGREIWFTGTKSGAAQAIYAVTRTGAERLLLRAPTTLTLHDVSRDGRALVSRDAWGAGVIALGPGSDRERDLSWLDGSTAWDMSADGTTIVIEESWEGGGANRSIYMRTTDGAPAVRLGEGVPLALSPDKQWVLSMPVGGDQLMLLPTGIGKPKPLPRGNIASYFPAARWLPDGRRFLVSGTEAGRKSRVFVQSIDSGDPRPVAPEGAYGRLAVLPGGTAFVTRGVDRRLAIYSLSGAESRAVSGTTPGDLPITASPDGEWLYVQSDTDRSTEIARINLRTGRRETVRSLVPSDPAGVMNVLRVVATPDAKWYAYTFVRALSSLFVVDGLNRRTITDVFRR